MAITRSHVEAHQRTISLTRTFDAPPARVFEAWTDPGQIVQWWAPEGFSVTTCEVEARVGGAFRLCMRSPEGDDYWMRAVYREIVRPERLHFTFEADDEAGKPAIFGFVNATFADDGGRTALTVQVSANGSNPKAAAMLQGMQEGWNQALAGLEAHIANPAGRKR
jgi:uncharacterized protein YndB with AHSA1/START domain